MSPAAVSGKAAHSTEVRSKTRRPPHDVLRSLSHLGERARQAVAAADAAAVILLRDGSPVYQSSTAFARAVDRIQYRIGQGPCVDAAVCARAIASGALGAGESRWPQFVAATRELEVASALSLPLLVEDEVIGSINFYSHQLDAFDDDSIYSGLLFARPVAALLSAASALEPNDPPAVRSVLPPGLVHGIEAVVAPPTNPQARSAAIANVVEEMYQTLAWANFGETRQAELCSLAQVLAAACAHEARMAALDDQFGAK